MSEIFTSLSTYGYIILFLYSLGGGMIALIAAGVMSYGGKLDITLCIVIACIANILGDTLIFYLSRYNRAEILPYIKKHRRKLALSHLLMKRYGDRIIIIKKFIYGLKTLIPLAVGLTGYSFVKFSILNVLASIIWAVSIGLISYFASSYIVAIVDFLGAKSWIFYIVICIILFAIWLYFNKTDRNKTIK